MPASRRSLLLALVFMGLACYFCGPQPVHAQQPGQPSGSHELWDRGITPEQVRAAFLRGRVGLPPELEKLVPGLTNEFKEQFPDRPEIAEAAVRRMLDDPNLKGFSPEMRDKLIRKAITNPEFKKRIEEGIANASKGNGTPPQVPSDIAKTLPDLSKAPNVLPKTDFGPPPSFENKLGPGTAFPTPGIKTPDKGTNPFPQPSGPKDPPPSFKTADPVPKKTGSNPTPPRSDEQPKAAEPKANPLGDDKTFKNPNDLAKEPPPDAGKNKARQAAATLWERNVGPLDETPDLKRALFDFVDGTGDLSDAEGNNFWDTLTKDGGGDGSSFADWLNNSANSDSMKMPSWDFPSLGLGRSDHSGGSSSSGDSWWSRRTSSSSSPSSPRSGSGSGFNIGVPGLEGTWLPVVLLAAVLLGGLLLWKFLYFRDAKPTHVFDLGGLGPWPVDPRAIATREDLIKAFEYLSVMICGPAARMWTHSTIATALVDLATTHSEVAMILARLYELARYAPLDEPLTADEIEESRRLVCRLAGVSYR